MTDVTAASRPPLDAPTAPAEGAPSPAPLTPDLVLFDDDCPMCRSLAELVVKRAPAAFSAVAWQEFRASALAAERVGPDAAALPADTLRVLTPSALLTGLDAWSHLLERHPDLAPLGWLAAQLGVTTPAARTLARSGALLRSLLCRACPR
jgi:hypothetical protein